MSIFKVGELFFHFPEGSIPKGSFLDLNLTTSNDVRREDGFICLDSMDFRAIKILHRYLVYGVVPDVDHIPILDAAGIELDHSYALSSIYEEHMRQHMYDDGYQDDPINTDLYYGLIKVTSSFWERFRVRRPDDLNLLFHEQKVEKKSWGEVQKSLEELKPLFALGESKVLVAGGRIFSSLFGTRAPDIDLFLYGTDVTQATETIFELVKTFGMRSITRTANAFTLNVDQKEYQVILRLYRTPSEVLHGFDVDCCSVGYDGENLWITQRAYYALSHGYNTVNFNRLSASYEYRLVKYGLRGIAIKIPDFDRDKVDVLGLGGRYQRWKKEVEQVTVGEARYRLIKGRQLNQAREEERKDKQLKGLDLLLYLEHHCRQYKWNKRTVVAVERLAGESSDYSPTPYKNYKGALQGSYLQDLVNYIADTSDKYPETAKNYMPHLMHLTDDEWHGPEDEEPRPLTQAEKILMDGMTNSLGAKEFAFLKISTYMSNYWIVLPLIKALLDIPDSIYLGLGAVFPWRIPQKIQWKTINPGEQMTGTFHKLVLEDTKVWYQGLYYRL